MKKYQSRISNHLRDLFQGSLDAARRSACATVPAVKLFLRWPLAFDLEADLDSDLKFLHLAIGDAPALLHDLEPVHVTDGL